MRKTTSSQASRLPRRTARRSAPALAAFLATFISLTGGSLPAAAQATQCGARDALIDRLAVKYDEEPISIGVTATGSLLEVLASPTGTWTIIVTVPGGPTCLVSSGDGWHNAPVQLAEDPAV